MTTGMSALHYQPPCLAVLRAAVEEGKTQAPFFLGTQLQLALWGILLIKGVEYYYHHRRDSLAGFWAVSLSLALQSCQTLILFARAYYVYGLNFGVASSMTERWHYSGLQGLAGLATNACVQMYFALRYWKRLNRNRWLFLCLALLFVTTYVLNILVVIYDVVLDRNIPRQPAYGMLLASTATKLMLDIIVTGLMVKNLRKFCTGLVETDRVLVKVAYLTLASGALPAVCNFASLICFATMKDSYVGYILRKAILPFTPSGPAISATHRQADPVLGARSPRLVLFARHTLHLDRTTKRHRPGRQERKAVRRTTPPSSVPLSRGPSRTRPHEQRISSSVSASFSFTFFIKLKFEFPQSSRV